MYICYGISNGPFYLHPVLDWEDDARYLWHAPLGCAIAVHEKSDLILDVPEFDSAKSTAVKITLTRKGYDVPLVEQWVNSSNLFGKPELVWGELR